MNLTFSVTSGEARFLAPGIRAGIGAGVEARDELAERPLVPLVTVAGAGARFAPHEETGFVAAADLPRDGKSPSERRLGGILCLRECRGTETSGWESASN